MAGYSKQNIKITEKGTELQLMNLKGKDYLPVAQRLVWFRERYPEGSIQTEIVQDGKKATARATIAVPINNNYVVLATGHKIETEDSFPDGHAEKAETGAIGRALAMAGFGTQFEPEFEEGERIVDAPVETTKSRSNAGAGPSKRSAPGPKEASPAGEANPAGTPQSGPGSVAAANTELRVVKAGETGPAEGAQDEEAYTKKLITAAAEEILNVKRIKTKDELKQVLKDKYGVVSSAKLNVTQAKEFLGYLNTLTA
jgi:hypothetical protein